MIYHLNAGFAKTLTGIEHAAINRLNLFKKYNIASKILTVKYTTEYGNIKAHGLHENDFIAMYDYFQKALHAEEKPAKINDVFPAESYKIVKVEDTYDYKVYKQGHYVAYVHCLEESGAVSYVNYFDKKQRKVKRCYYDCRGFLSSEKILAQNQFAAMEIYYTPSGENVIEKYFQQENEKAVLTMIKVKNTKNDWDYFYSEDDLIAFFLETLLLENEDVLIVDKNIIYSKPIINMKKKIRTISIIHSTHTQGRDHIKSPIKSHYRTVFDNMEKFDTIVASTERQRQDIIERFGHSDRIRCIPVGFRSEVKQNSLKNPPKIIVVARLTQEKRVEHCILAFSKAAKKIRKAQLHIFGHGSKEAELRELASDLKLDDKVKFRGYLHDLSSEYETSKLIISSSFEEGLSLAMLEAASYGIPAVSYDIKYGLAEIIEDNKSGFLTFENPDELAEKIITLLSNAALYKQFSNNAYEKSFSFSEERIIKKWKNLLKC